jgi:hypothetical protein
MGIVMGIMMAVTMRGSFVMMPIIFMRHTAKFLQRNL